MNDTNQIFERERQFWTGDERFYQENLARVAMMVFPPPAGVLDRAGIVRAISGGPRWTEVEMVSRQCVELAPGVLAVSYLANARRRAGPVYRAVTASVYVREDSHWRLAFHQQTTVGDDPSQKA